MTKRGKVLRDPHTAPALLMVEGQQYPFSLEGIWASEIPPKPGSPWRSSSMTTGVIARITAIPESQLAREQAEAAMAAAKQHGAALASKMVARFGIPNLVAAALLIVGWFFSRPSRSKPPSAEWTSPLAGLGLRQLEQPPRRTFTGGKRHCAGRGLLRTARHRRARRTFPSLFLEGQAR